MPVDELLTSVVWFLAVFSCSLLRVVCQSVSDASSAPTLRDEMPNMVLLVILCSYTATCNTHCM